MRDDFHGNMGEPTTPEEYKRKYGVYPPGYDQDGNKKKSNTLACIRTFTFDGRKKELQKYRKLLIDDYQTYVPLMIGDLTSDPTIETVKQFDQWVKDNFSDWLEMNLY